jgi:hypothetical protein
MKKIILFTIITISIFSCKYNPGPPIIVKKQMSFLPGKCHYTYEGYGREEMFDDDCDKYSVGDTLGVK